MTRVQPRNLILLLAAVLLTSAAQASVSIYMPPEHLAARAELVVEGTVTRTASGLDAGRGALATYVTLAIDQVHRGPAQLREVVIREPGGRHGNLINVVDAAPAYTPGETVLVFLEAAADGALRTSGLFFGKFQIQNDENGRRIAVRRTEGRHEVTDGTRERLRRSDLVALTATTPSPAARPGSPAVAWQAVPPEMNRLEWDAVRTAPRRDGGGISAVPVELAASERGELASRNAQEFNYAEPVRWEEVDSGEPIVVHVERGDDPLGDESLAVEQILRAMQSWNAVPQARIELTPGSTDSNYTSRHSQSPSEAYGGRENIVLFGDPYDVIPDPIGCTGVLALGGYWREAYPGDTVNGIEFHPIRQLYVMFNDGFECFLGEPDNLAEVAAHELGHGIGFAHSSSADSIMRASAYGYRGPRLGNDDANALHCHYPHTLTLETPNGGETLRGGRLHSIVWNATEEASGSRGSVTLQYSADDGASWQSIVDGAVNDGHHLWRIPSVSSDFVRVRVAQEFDGEVGAEILGYPEFCSADQSDSSASIEAAPQRGRARGTSRRVALPRRGTRR
ncbi:MAG: matrixin family metalloprotease [bacterium]|nr:matrixin family metalloprotease [bacterium]